jgi:hypothetical protein
MLIKFPVAFTDPNVALIAKAVSVRTHPHRLKLLPQVLREWAEVDLREAAFFEACRAGAPAQAARFEKLARSTRSILNDMAVLEPDDLDLIAFEMAREGKSIPNPERHEHFRRKLMELRDLLNRGQAAVESLQKQLKRGRGQPRNVLAYLVLKDVASIFEWLTGLQARREVDRKNGCETGVFYPFCEAIWPPVFASGLDGLSAAIKNWAFGHRKYKETSALVVNIAMRHPFMAGIRSVTTQYSPWE